LQKIELLIIPIGDIQVGIYQDSILIKSIKSELMSSEFLPDIYDKLSKKYDIKTVYFINGPGSYMAIKLTYIFLTTIAIVKDIPIKAANGFHFNSAKAIKALGNKYFILVDEKIELKSFDEKIEYDFILPINLNVDIFNNNIKPIYMLPAV